MLLRFAIQKTGRLTYSSRLLISECGIELEPAGAKLSSPAFNFPVEVLFLRDDEIPRYVADGTVDCAVIGQNFLIEQCVDIEPIRMLDFGQCRLAIALPKPLAMNGWSSLHIVVEEDDLGCD